MTKTPLYVDPRTGEEYYALTAKQSLFILAILVVCIAVYLFAGLIIYKSFKKKDMETPEKTVYIAGPISNMPHGNVKAFAEATRTVRNMGHIAKNPHELCHDIPKGSPWETYMRRCIPHLMECTDIVLLPGWQQSDGANLEHLNASIVGITIHDSLEHFVARAEHERNKTLENA